MPISYGEDEVKEMLELEEKHDSLERSLSNLKIGYSNVLKTVPAKKISSYYREEIEGSIVKMDAEMAGVLEQMKKYPSVFQKYLK